MRRAIATISIVMIFAASLHGQVQNNKATPIPKDQTPNPTLSHVKVVADHVYASSAALWEFSTAVAPPGTAGCPKGRTFVTGSSNLPGALIPLHYQAELLCAGPNCATDVYSTKIKNTLVAKSGLEPNDFVKNDVVMARLANGGIVIARVVRRELPQRRFGMMIWGSADCGENWSKRFYIDPSDTKWDKDGRYGKPRETFQGGWDRQEIYADPWTGNLFITLNGNGGKGSDNINKMLLFRSTDSGFSWDVKELSNGQSAPVMMTSLPGSRLFLLDVSGSSPRIRWSTDGGKTLSQTYKVYWNDGTGEPKAGSHNSISTRPVKVEGSIGISRISHFVASNGSRTNQIRVSYPSLLNRQQVLRIITVTIREDGSPPTMENVRTIELARNAQSITSLIQATVVEPDPTLISKNAIENTALIYWREIEKPFTVGGIGTTSIRGVLVRGKNTVSPIIPLSTDASGKLRKWAGGFYGHDEEVVTVGGDSNVAAYKTGDYSKGGFYFEASKNELRYWVQWVETDVTGKQRTIHGSVIGVPRASQAALVPLQQDHTKQ